MKNYFMNILGAVLVSGFLQLFLPSGWSRYTKILSGIIIICAMLSPVKEIFDFEMLDYTVEGEKIGELGEERTKISVAKELERRIGEDIEVRMREEFGEEVKAECRLSTNENEEITAVDEVIITGEVTEEMIKRIKEIYAPVSVRVRKK